MATANINLSTLAGANGFRIEGAAADDFSGVSVSGAGDVNGDGFEDLIVGATGVALTGASYVVFGKSSGFSASVDLSTLDGTNGFRLEGVPAGFYSGSSVGDAGDVNGDGFEDLIVGGRGWSYVVFGKASGFAASVDLSALDGKSGFALSVMVGLVSNYSVSGAGDVNGDGFDDLIVGARNAGPNEDSSGASYVVFGKSSGFAASVNLSTLNGANGYRLAGVAAGDLSGWSVSNAGDVNGDGLDDLIVGANGADPNGEHSGASYVVFGKASGFGASINLSMLDGTNGFRLAGVAAYDGTGFSLSAAGDVNGDGFDDLIVGAPFADANGSDSGASYVVFGRSSGFLASINLSTLDGTNGFRLAGAAAIDISGRSVSGAGDVNGDGFDDLIVAAPFADTNGYASGASYVVFGKSSGFAASINLSTLDGTSGLRLAGVAVGDVSGWSSVSGAGDVNGDGFDDLIVGAPFADPNGLSSGASYVIFGSDFNGAVTYLGTSGADTLSGTLSVESFVSGQGNDTLEGGGGADVFHAGEGDDVIQVSSASFAVADGGSGQDTLALTGGGLTLDLALPANVKISGIETIDLTGSGDNTLTVTSAAVLDLSTTTNALTINGNAQDSVNMTGVGWTGVGLSGDYRQYTKSGATLSVATDITVNLIGSDSAADLITGSEFDEAIFGLAGNDTLNSRAGNDTLDGGVGTDTLIGGTGNDTYVVDSTADTITELSNGGTDTVQSSVNFSLAALEQVENVTLTGSANVEATGSSRNNVLLGNDTDNRLAGLAGNDTLDGGTGNDTLDGGSGNDALVGGEGIDEANYEGTNSGVVVNLSTGTATGGAGSDVLNGIENVTGSGFNDRLTGDAMDNVLRGGQGNDTLDGGEGIDAAIYSGNRAVYAIGNSGTSVSGPDGTDALTSIERLQFTDKMLAIDLGAGQAAGNTVRIIGAVFDSPAIAQHPNWVGIGLDLFDSGMSMQSVCELVVQIVGLSNTEFVTSVYTNVVGAAPSDSARDSYVGLLQGSGGTMTQADLLVLASNAGVNATNIDLVGLQQSGVEFT